MSIITGSLRCIIMILIILSPSVFATNSLSIPILCYHNFSPTTPGSMNMTPERLDSQFKWLKEHGFNVISLNEATDYLLGEKTSLPSKSIVITVDDGWQSAYTYLYPILKKYHYPVTLFIYPETISNGKHAMTWEELKDLQQTGLFDIQSHTYSHPNFKREKRALSPARYEQFVKTELTKSKKILEEKLGTKITLLAWPFGIYNPYLEQQAQQAGYRMAFSIDAKSADRGYKDMAQPRFMIIQAQSMKTFEWIANTAKNNN